MLQYILTGITTGSVYALVALGFTVIFNSTGIINFAQGEFLVFGGLLFYSLHVGAGLPLALALLLAVGFTAILGLFMERLAIRPLLRAPLVTLIIVTIGCSMVLRGIAHVAWGSDALPVTAFSGDAAVFQTGAAIHPPYLWVLGLASLAFLTLWFFFQPPL